MSQPSSSARRSLASIATIVAIATLISKLAGLVRQQAIAAQFGAGAEVDAYQYAYIIPGFLFILLGGINGPFHSSIISVLARRPEANAAKLIETINTFIGGLLLILTLGLMVSADPLLKLIAPGAPPNVHLMAVEQFRIMAPLAVLSGLIGIGFGTLNAAEHYWLPSISPLLSSVTVIVAVWFFSDYGAEVMAWGTLAGGFLQWFVQIPAQWKSGMGTLRLRFDFGDRAVMDIFRLMGPATLSSGMLLVSVYITTVFASQLPVGAASALGYAQLLFLTPLGILSNVLLVPYMSIFSELAAPKDWPNLKERIRQSLVLTALSMMPIGVLMAALALPAVRIVYERGQFDQQASALVSSLLLVYSVGMFFYLARDVLVRAFYGLGDGAIPLVVTLIGLGFNALFCFLFTQLFGAQGLAMSTVGVNTISMVVLLLLLSRRIDGLPWRGILVPIVGLAVGSVVSGFVAWGVLLGSQRWLGMDGLLIQLLQLTVAGTLGLLVFAGFAWMLKLPETDLLLGKIRQKVPFLR